MNKRRRNKKRIQSMISRMLYLASALALLTFILGIVMIALKQTNNDSIARTRNFNLVESATDEMVENLSDDQITFQNIMNSYDWESVPENWIVDIYDGQDDLFFRHGDESNILATDMSVTKKTLSGALHAGRFGLH